MKNLKHNHKFTESIDINDWQVETECGAFVDILSTNKTIPYQIYKVNLENGLFLECADTHIVFTKDKEQIFVKDALNVNIRTKYGISKVISIERIDKKEQMYDLSIDSIEHSYYTNGILSHNTTTTVAYILWYTLFNEGKTVAILANKHITAREILSRYQLMYEYLPLWMQQGIKTWNKGDIELENKSKVFTAATSASGVRGKSANLLYIDEAAIIPNSVADQFFASVYPIVSAGKTTKIIMTSTPLGYNHFWKYWNDAEKNINGFVPFFVPYWKVPGRDEVWAEEQLKVLGELKYNQEVLCKFLGSSSTLIRGDIIEQMSYTTPVYSKEDLDLLEYPVAGHSYVICVDIAQGVGGDYSAFTIIDVSKTPYKLVGKYRNNKIAPLLFPSIIYKASKDFNNAYVLVEINTTEQVSHILYTEYSCENLLFVQRDGRGQYISSGFGSSVRMGLSTDRRTKRTGCAQIKSLIEEKKLIITDFDVISEISTFVESHGSYAADDGYHDDLMMTLVIFGWLTTQEYFREITNINLREELYQQRIRQIEDEMLPIGFFRDGNQLEVTKEADDIWLEIDNNISDLTPHDYYNLQLNNK